MQYLLASLNWREVAREARRREFPRTAVRYNQFIIPKEFTLFFLSTQDYFNLHKIILIHTKVSAPSNHCDNYNYFDACHGAPSRRALQRFLHPRSIVIITTIAIPINTIPGCRKATILINKNFSTKNFLLDYALCIMHYALRSSLCEL